VRSSEGRVGSVWELGLTSCLDVELLMERTMRLVTVTVMDSRERKGMEDESGNRREHIQSIP